MTAFHDLPHGQRMAYRHAIDAAGGEVAGYQREYVQVAVPREDGPSSPWPPTGFYAALAAAGLVYVEGSAHHFPLGGDNAPEALRHDGRYPGSRGFWLYASFRPAG